MGDGFEGHTRDDEKYKCEQCGFSTNSIQSFYLHIAFDCKNKLIRTFESGATRDTDEGKLDYEGFFSPLVTKRRAEYMHLHRKQSDGTMRDGDNWQKGIPYREALKSFVRHSEDIKLLSRGYDAREDIETAICACMFNLESMLLTILTDKSA